MDTMFALVSGSPRAVRMASDQASWFWPFGVSFSAVACGVSPELDVVAELELGAGLGADVAVAVGVQLGVTCGLDGIVVGVAATLGLAVTFRGVPGDATPCGIFAT